MVCGVDGCPAGWVVTFLDCRTRALSFAIAPDFGSLLAMTEPAVMVAVDIPIGLLDAAAPRGRACDREARHLLGPRSSSVFSPPVYGALRAATYREAVATNRASSKHGLGLSKQCYALFPRLREVHAMMTPELQKRIKEVHPELCFRAMNAETPLVHAKRTVEGINLRLRLLDGAGFPRPHQHLSVFAKSTAAPDDVLDAMAAAWTAARLQRGTAQRIPREMISDRRGLQMEMWY